MVWTLIHIADWTLWLTIGASVVYVVFFAFASLSPNPSPKGEGSRKGERAQSRFVVIFPAYHEDKVIRTSIEAFLRQDYPSDLFKLVVVSDHMQPETNEWLAAQPLLLLQPTFEKSSKAKALQFAIGQLESLSPNPSPARPLDACYHRDARKGEERLQNRYMVILDADNVVGTDFLSRLDLVCQQGYQAIQCHRTAKNADNDVSALDGLSEEINNTLFRRAHNNIGMSSALIGSGMCFDYKWFCEHVNRLQSAVEDRELEALLMKEGIFIKYEEDIHVYDEKVNNQDNFQRQRLRWMTGQVQALLQMTPYLPTALRKGNINYIDKTIQQALIPRSILLVAVPFMALLITLLSPLWSIKWWVLLLCLCIALLIAVPARLRTTALFGKLFALPHLVWRLLKNIVRIDHKNTDFIHTTHDK